MRENKLSWKNLAVQENYYCYYFKVLDHCRTVYKWSGTINVSNRKRFVQGRRVLTCKQSRCDVVTPSCVGGCRCYKLSAQMFSASVV